MDKEILEKLGITVEDGVTDEEIKSQVLEKLDEKETHIKELESEKNALSKDKEELTTSVEGYKSREENLSKELSETKEELTKSKARLEQVTELYKEHFTKDSDVEPETKSKEDLHDDVLQSILDSK